MQTLSVLICTHNPRESYLERVLEALRAQTLPQENWELVLIDNQSTDFLASKVDISWHRRARHVREETLGLTAARLRGIAESTGDILVFVDDDNILAVDYLEICLDLFKSNSLLGALGSANIIPEFETQPALELVPYLPMLALREETTCCFSNEVKYTKALPYGAGLCIKMDLARSYSKLYHSRSFAVLLDRQGSGLLSGGDIDLVLHVCREGLVAGVLPYLKITHLIPTVRLQKEYFIRLWRGHVISAYYLSKIWDYDSGFGGNPIVGYFRTLRQLVRKKGFERRIELTKIMALRKAKRDWKQIMGGG